MIMKKHRYKINLIKSNPRKKPKTRLNNKMRRKKALMTSKMPKKAATLKH